MASCLGSWDYRVDLENSTLSPKPNDPTHKTMRRPTGHVIHWMWLDTLDCQYAPEPQAPVDTQLYASYTTDGWFGFKV